MRKQKQTSWLIVLAILMLAAGRTVAQEAKPSAQTKAPAATAPKASAGLSVAEFSRVSRELSEDGGYFRSDNFTSNETAYLTVLDKLQQLSATGGAYIGVGPEQNFTYIARIRPRIAFIIDIRRQAVIQHLMYKAVFHLSPDRVQFLSRLLSRPLPKEKAPTRDSALADILNFFSAASLDEKTYTANLAVIRKTIQEDFQYPLTDGDKASLEYVYKSFCTDGLGIAYRVDGTWNNSYFPTLKDMIAQTDLQGRTGNFLASNEDYEFVRNLHRQNLIIPVVGDFAGTKAIAAVGEYLRKSNFTVTAFYTSNVEQYLFQNQVFDKFANNVRKLPLTDKSLFIRSATGRFPHPARLPGHRATTLLQQMTLFLKDFDAERYQSYYDLVMMNFIAPERP